MRFCCSVSCITLLLAAQAVQAEPLKPMLSDLLATHPRVKAAAEQVESSKEGEREAFSGFLPTLTGTAGKGRERTDRTDLVPAGSKTTYSTTNYGLTASQNLFQGFSTRAAVRSAEVSTVLSEETLNLTKQQIMLEAVSSYLDVLKQVQLTELSMENQNTLKTQLHLEDERVQRGSGIAVDILQAKSRLQIAKERYSAFTGALNDAKSRFAQVFGKPVAMESITLPPIPETQIPRTLDEAIKIAVNNNPTLVGSKHTATIAEYGKTSAQSGFWPSVDIVGSSTFDDNAGGIRGEEKIDAVTLRASWQLFNGFADHARSKRAAHDYQAALDNSIYVRRKVEEDVKLAWSSLITSKDRAELLDNAVNIAGEVYDARKKLRDVGSDTALNVLDAENELFRAKIDAVAARYDYYTAIYRLLYAMGMLHLEKI